MRGGSDSRSEVIKIGRNTWTEEEGERHRQTKREREAGNGEGGDEEKEGEEGAMAGRDREKPLSSANMSWGEEAGGWA